ncbi:imidazolonepropionase-like amidohydrolase [Clostridiales Family XIII bacterium PM5-7]
MFVLRNARLIPELTEEFEGNYGDVVVDEGVIQEIKPAKSVAADEDKLIDMTGKTLLPGLIEGHLHLDLCGKNTFEENVEPVGYRLMRCLRLAQDNLKQGYTTVRDVGDRENITIGMARAVNEGMVMGPDILTSGMIISPTEKGNEFFGTMYAEADSVDEMTKAVRRQYQLGADWIKIMGTGAVMNPGGVPGMPIIYEEELAAAVRAADYVGLPVAVHCHGTEAIKMCIRCGVRTVEHSSIMDEECIRMYKASEQSFPMPTMSPMVNFLEFPEGKPAHYVEKAKIMMGELLEGLRAYRENNVKIGWATDAGVYEGSHGNGIYEFRARVNLAGFTPLETLIQATKNNAEILMIDDQVGTIKCGKRANLVAFDGNPDEDIEVLNKVALVVKAGEII